MRQITQNYKTGELSIRDVEHPSLKADGVVVQTAYSVISVGTEGMKVREAKMNLIEKARSRPDHVKAVIDSARNQGVVSTFHKVINRLDSLTPLGYSLSGIVTAVGERVQEFEVGQRVACAGANLANHAEYNYIPKNLVVPVPDGVRLDHASFATIGAIALHAMRQSEIRLGESAVVVGLGLIGQMLVRLLKAGGVRVFGIDPDLERCEMAIAAGAEAASPPDDVTWEVALKRASWHAGADCVFLTLASTSNGPLELATKACRDRGRIVVVGKTRTNLDFETFLKKEIDVRFSRSYGPGRYDPEYENKGRDYPIAYVRWTERRNLSAFLALIEHGGLNINSLITHRVAFDSAAKVYQQIEKGNLSGVGIVLDFQNNHTEPRARQLEPNACPAEVASVGPCAKLGVIGLGNYAGSMLVPHLISDKRVFLSSVATSTPLSAANAARKFGFCAQSTDYKSLLNDETLDAVIIATRHKTHAKMVADALRSNKTVFVEKPLAIDKEGLKEVRAAAEESGNQRLIVGFNRRHSQIMQSLKSRLSIGPHVMLYRVHAGRLDPTTWLSDREEGSRFVGEAGHFLDVFAYLTEAEPVSVTGHCLRPRSTSVDDLDNISVTVRYSDGSIGCLSYLTQGARAVPKERLEVFSNGETLVMDNFSRLVHYQQGGKTRTLRGFGGKKGQKEQMDAFVSACLVPNNSWSFEELMLTSLLTLEAETSALEGRFITVS
jgi:predicted dehydrogenase/threonine dehydrogenase-like Zn-dependent dehydrogenase